MEEQTSQNQEFQQAVLFKYIMRMQWQKVVEIFKKHHVCHTTMLTKSKETALHIVVSIYDFEGPPNTDYVKQMIDLVQDEVLFMQNVEGDTPLHLAAMLGRYRICEMMASKNWKLITVRNAYGETPLFVAANYGNLRSFLCLHEELSKTRNDREPDESLCRRRNGDTILHQAILGTHFRLAYQIISYYPKLVHFVNVEGESPLHVLARKPNVFRSSSHFGFFESIIYHCVFVDDLKEEKYSSKDEDGCAPGCEINVPGNYRTSGFTCFKKPNHDPNDEEYQQQNGPEPQNVKAKRCRWKKQECLPDNTTCFLIFKFLMKIILSVVVGFWRIKNIEKKKEQCCHASQIMNKMIESEADYIYDSDGQHPSQRYELEHLEWPPDTPPSAVDEHDDIHSTDTDEGRKTSCVNDQQQNGDDNDQNKLVKKTPNGLVKKETPLLVATKVGIQEMVKKIIEECPEAIEDLDSTNKNVLQLAAENRQTIVLEDLLNMYIPENMFDQLDGEGNNILHLAAKLEDPQPWSIAGAALQMQSEIKWYKFVERSYSLWSSGQNSKGETPRMTFTRTHQNLVKEGTKWLIRTSESCSVVATLIAAAAFTTASTVPGGPNQTTGYPIFERLQPFDVFSITFFMALCLSATALVFFLGILTSRTEESDFETDLPIKLLMGLVSLFASIAAMLVSFCAGHSIVMREVLKFVGLPIYAIGGVPVAFFAIVQLPLFFDILRTTCSRVPLRRRP